MRWWRWVLQAFKDGSSMAYADGVQFRRGTEAERVQAIAEARKRLSDLQQQTLRSDQIAAAATAEAFDRALVERLERGDPFTVPKGAA